ncbi:MAG: ABC transporter permease [Cellvibrionaceae bacterium]|nr:ABC transporter permease [Cellvibrionaceae bacterium]
MSSALVSLLAPLDRKLLRDLLRMKGQAIAIAAVVAVGVMLLVMMDGLVNSLEQTKRAYYERYRLAQVTAPLKRAPEYILQDIARLPGVAAVEGRMRGGALINMPGAPVPIRAQALSLPEHRSPQLNNIYLSAGRLLDPGREDEILLLESFALAHGLAPGDSLAATVNGSRRSFEISGLAQSPEFLYSAPPGELMPDDGRFGVIWMGEKAMAAAFDLKGAVNEVLLSLVQGAELKPLLQDVDRILAPYGGLGAAGREEQLSDRFVSEEIDGLKATSATIPPVFLAVAAFLLNMVIGRMVESEREQIGLLKAFGYTDTEVGLHYLKFTLCIAIGGALLGCLLGVIGGRLLIDVYLIYYKLPFLVFELAPSSLLVGLGVSVMAASAGGALVLGRVFGLNPAVAMRPPAPVDYSRTANFSAALKARLDQPSRMVLRRLLRQPMRSALAVLGIAAGMSLSVAMLGVFSGFERIMSFSFEVVDRSDARVSFIEPYGDKALYELQSIPGVMAVEPFRTVAATLRHGVHHYRLGINGLLAEPQLNRALAAAGQPVYIRGDGIVLSRSLANILQVEAGQLLRVEVKEGRRPVLELPVIRIVESLLGSPAYMELAALNRALKQPGRLSGAYLRIDSQHSQSVYRALKTMPSVAGVNLKDEARRAFAVMIDSGAGFMRYIMVVFAGVITFGIVYNSARIAYAERARDLASLRVIGFTRAEAAFVLLGELGLVTLAALPLGCVLGYFLLAVVCAGFSTDLYQIPAVLEPKNFGAAIAVVVLAGLVSGLMIKRDIDNIDMVSALKTRE